MFIKPSFFGYRAFSPLITVTIFAERLLHNLHTYQRHYPRLDFGTVLKSNAYGHGLELVAKILDREGLPFLIVDSTYEALLLRRSGIRSDILIVGFTPLVHALSCSKKNIVVAVTSLEQLTEYSRRLRRDLRIHIKIDTGMHRQGLLPDQIFRAIELVNDNPRLRLEGICSHLSTPSDDDFSRRQEERWAAVVALFRKSFSRLRYIHLAATDGMPYTDGENNVVRLGLGLYGMQAAIGKQLPLLPALRMESVISSTKSIAAGESVGYDKTFTAPGPMRLATIPAGYFEGLDRRLSNKGSVTINGTFCKIAGRVSMNITTVVADGVPEAIMSTPVTIISENSADPNSIQSMAQLCQTDPRELLVHIPPHLRRVSA